jgi:hypothetical protein
VVVRNHYSAISARTEGATVRTAREHPLIFLDYPDFRVFVNLVSEPIGRVVVLLAFLSLLITEGRARTIHDYEL